MHREISSPCNHFASFVLIFSSICLVHQPTLAESSLTHQVDEQYVSAGADTPRGTALRMLMNAGSIKRPATVTESTTKQHKQATPRKTRKHLFIGVLLCLALTFSTFQLFRNHDGDQARLLCFRSVLPDPPLVQYAPLQVRSRSSSTRDNDPNWANISHSDRNADKTTEVGAHG